MKARVRLFAVAKELAGTDTVCLDMPVGSTVAELRRALAEQLPALASILPQILLAVNAEYVGDDAVIPPDAELACIPPVSGG